MKTIEERIAILFPLFPSKYFLAKVRGKRLAVSIQFLLGIWKKGVGNSRRMIGIDKNGRQYSFCFSDCENKSRIFHFCQLFNSQRHITDLIFALRQIEKLPDDKKEKAIANLFRQLAGMNKNKNRKKEMEREKVFSDFVRENQKALQEASEYYQTKVEFIGGLIQ